MQIGHIEERIILSHKSLRGSNGHFYLDDYFSSLELPKPVGLYPLNEDTLKDSVTKDVTLNNSEITKGPGGKREFLQLFLFMMRKKSVLNQIVSENY